METREQAEGESRVHGIAASPGLARGPLLVLENRDALIPKRPIHPDQFPAELERLRVALERTRQQLVQISEAVRQNVGEKDAEIFEAHLLVLDDATLLNAVHKQLELKKFNIEFVYSHVVNQYADAIGALEDGYLSERAADIRDVSRRVTLNLMGGECNPFSSLTEPSILVAHELSPSDTALMPRHLVLGFVTAVGSKTSHSAIMARSMDIPAMVASTHDDVLFETGVSSILDGTHGLLIINPTEQTRTAYGAIATRHTQVSHELEQLRTTEATTTDGRKIILSANMEMMADIQPILESGADGIGLFRSEFLFLGRDDLPSEQEQYNAYAAVARAFKPQRVILRTLDLGGDKLASSLGDPDEDNPFLGVRAIRLCLAHPDMFRVQLRAMLRAATEGNVAIMYPMVSSVLEVRAANQMLWEECEKLRAQGTHVPAPDQIEIGVMIEVPSAALTSEILATEVKFFSIGTNDLIQYCTAIDRGNQKLAHLYEPTHPGVLRLIEHVVTAARENGIWVGLCGEMASEFILAPLLVGMGLDELSTGPAQIPRIKRVIRSVSYAEMKDLADRLLNEHSSDAILVQLEELARQRFPELFD